MTLLLIALSNQGYWFGGEPATISLQSAVAQLPKADLVWELRYDGVRLDRGTAQVPGDEKAAANSIAIHPAVPEVRARVTMHWIYRMIARDTKKELESGDVPVYVFPRDAMQGLAVHLEGRRLMVCDKSASLPELLKRAAIPFTLVSAPGNLVFAHADDLVLVGEDVLTASPFEQAPLIHLAEAGASVMIFRQSKTPRVIGYPLGVRSALARLDWRMDHPLLAGFDRNDLRNWMTGAAPLRAVELPADEPALEIGFVAPELAGSGPAPINAVLVSKSIGLGRIVLCQLPLGDWKSDPRSQMLLRNAIEYLLTRPQPMPRRSSRLAGRLAAASLDRTVLVSHGGKP
jgi:hypothetical protein